MAPSGYMKPLMSSVWITGNSRWNLHVGTLVMNNSVNNCAQNAGFNLAYFIFTWYHFSLSSLRFSIYDGCRNFFKWTTTPHLDKTQSMESRQSVGMRVHLNQPKLPSVHTRRLQACGRATLAANGEKNASLVRIQSQAFIDILSCLRFLYISLCRETTLKLDFWSSTCAGEHNGVVHDIAWAPVMGRSYHLIATASRENCFRVSLDYNAPSCEIWWWLILKSFDFDFVFKIHKLLRKEDGSLVYDRSQVIHTKDGSSVWRVSWNTTGKYCMRRIDIISICL